MKDLMLGTKTWRYGLACPLSEAIRRTADLGFRFIDINSHLIRYEKKIYYWPKEIAPTYRDKIKQLLRGHSLEAGIVIPKTPLLTKEDLGSIKIEDIAELSDITEEKALSFPFRLKLGIDTARDLSVQLLDDIHLPSSNKWTDIEHLKSIIKSIETHDVKIGLENRDDTDPKQLLKTLKELNMRNVGLTFDMGHFYNYFKDSEMVVEQIRKLGDFICHVHVHEESKNSSSTKFGLGNINWIKIIKAFKTIEFSGSLTLEMDPEDCYILSMPPHPDPEVLRYKWTMEYLLKDAYPDLTIPR